MTQGTYYFQTERICLIPAAVDGAFPLPDSDALAMVHEEVPLPAQMDASVPAFAIMDHSGNRLGHIHFNYINERHGTFSLGILLEQDARGHGYGWEAMRLCMKYAFEERRLHKFEGYCLDDNAASRRMLEKLGCMQEGISRECVFLHGRFHDRIIFGMMADEWFAMNK